MRRGIAAELLIARKRASTWILLSLWTLLALVFAYIVPYVQYLNGSTRQSLDELLPQHLVAQLMAGFPFFGGVFALMLGVLAVGSEYGWGTLKTLFTQRPGRLWMFAAKLVGLAATLVVFVLAVYAFGALSSYVIAVREGAEVARPSASLLFSALAGEVSLVDGLVQFFLRANGYSLAAALGVSAEDVSDRGPGSFSGPFVTGGQALLVLASYLVVLVAASGWLLRRRDVV